MSSVENPGRHAMRFCIVVLLLVFLSPTVASPSTIDPPPSELVYVDGLTACSSATKPEDSVSVQPSQQGSLDGATGDCDGLPRGCFPRA